MKTAASGANEIRSLRVAAGLCLASPVATCLVLPEGRLHVFNESWRARYGAQDSLPAALSNSFAQALEGTSALTAALSFVPVRDDETNVVVGVLVTATQGESAGEQFDSFRYTLSHDLLSPLRTMQEM